MVHAVLLLANQVFTQDYWLAASAAIPSHQEGMAAPSGHLHNLPSGHLHNLPWALVPQETRILMAIQTPMAVAAVMVAEEDHQETAAVLDHQAAAVLDHQAAAAMVATVVVEDHQLAAAMAAAVVDHQEVVSHPLRAR